MKRWCGEICLCLLFVNDIHATASTNRLHSGMESGESVCVNLLASTSASSNVATQPLRGMDYVCHLLSLAASLLAICPNAAALSHDSHRAFIPAAAQAVRRTTPFPGTHTHPSPLSHPVTTFVVSPPCRSVLQPLYAEDDVQPANTLTEERRKQDGGNDDNGGLTWPRQLLRALYQVLGVLVAVYGVVHVLAAW